MVASCYAYTSLLKAHQKRWAFLLPAESQSAEHALSKRLVVLGNSH